MDNGFAEGYAVGQGNSNANNGWGFGAGWEWIWIIILFAFWGNGGWGNGGNGGSMLSGALTRGDLCSEFSFNDLQNGVRNVNDSVNLGFSNLNSTICHQEYETAMLLNNMNVSNLQQFNAANVATLQGFNGVQSQMAQCCCNIERGIDRLSCEAANNTGAIIASSQANTQRILDYLCNEKISGLQAKLASAEAQISNQATANYIVNAIRPYPQASFVVPNPYTGAYGGYGYGSCNCGCNG